MQVSSKEFIDSVFSSDGILNKILKDYELRDEQRQMSLQILDAYEKEKIALIEAGTGIGKSWAYLIPAIYWAVSRGEQTVISTHTIPLQEQLTEKDVPFLLRSLGVDIKVVLVKGMSNYICLKKLNEVQNETLSLLPDEHSKLSQVQDFAETSNHGSYSDLPFPVPQNVWDLVSAERGSCSTVQCPYYRECFFFKVRKQMSDAQVLIVNHHLLMADLLARAPEKGREEKALLPKFHRLIIDEAHHLDEIALESLAKKNDKIDLVRWLGRIYSDHHPEKSRSQLFLKDLIRSNIKNPTLEMNLQTDLPGEKRQVALAIEDLFKQLEFYCQTYLKEDRGSESKDLRWRLKAQHLLSAHWQTNIKPSFLQVSAHLLKIATMLGNIRGQLRDVDKSVMEKLAVHLQEMEFIAQTLSQKAEDLKAFTENEQDVSRVRWIEMTGFLSNMMLTDAHLNVSDYLKTHLFDPRVSTVLCSATLTSSHTFDFIKERIGLRSLSSSLELSEKIYPSPFDYMSRVLLLVPKDIPLPSESGFMQAAADAIYRSILASRGSCFVLFTSYDMLRQVYRLVEGRLNGFALLRQGDASRQVLIEQFKSKEGNVLFATDSFWEGVDVPGEALRCVIIVKLPFKVPSDPIYQAFSELYEKDNRDPFSLYSLPSASIKFKQGFGRLIRKKEDRGCIVCLDKRLMTKSYGNTFLKSIPDCKKVYENSDTLFASMKDFYEKTRDKKR
ncbi:MAG: DEAD/DEAH box helicase family protein [Chlamydiae bacterium]|nr:DEAD/DEAH box helicase family protein [Chlamydiota bacterium]